MYEDRYSKAVEQSDVEYSSSRLYLVRVIDVRDILVDRYNRDMIT